MASSADVPKSAKQSGPRVSEWDGVRDDLAALNDRLDRLTAVLISVNGKKPPKFHPYARPRTASDTIRDRRTIAENQDLVNKLAQLPRR